ncbi:hypothetical protein D3C81_1810360 [compost metagenome]
MIQPGLEGAGNRKVVHRRRQHQDIRGQQLVSELIGAQQRRLLGSTLLGNRLHPAAQQVGIQMRNRVAGQIADGHLILWMCLLPLSDELGSQLPGYRALLTDTAFDYENLGHLSLPPPGHALDR